MSAATATAIVCVSLLVCGTVIKVTDRWLERPDVPDVELIIGNPHVYDGKCSATIHASTLPQIERWGLLDWPAACERWRRLAEDEQAKGEDG